MSTTLRLGRRLALAAALALAGSAACAQSPCSLVCPANIALATAPGADAVTVGYAVPTPSGDNCVANTVVQTAGLPPGSNFPVGTTTNAWRVDVVGGGFATCQFSVTVRATPAFVQVPTLSHAALGALAALLLAGVAWARSRRSR